MHVSLRMLLVPYRGSTCYYLSPQTFIHFVWLNTFGISKRQNALFISSSRSRFIFLNALKFWIIYCLHKRGDIRNQMCNTYKNNGTDLKPTILIRHFFFLFNVPFKIISLISRRANQYVGRKREYPGKNHLTHPQEELDLSHIWPLWGSNPHQPQRVRWSKMIKDDHYEISHLNHPATGAAD